jgi:hypothetical protein
VCAAAPRGGTSAFGSTLSTLDFSGWSLMVFPAHSKLFVTARINKTKRGIRSSSYAQRCQKASGKNTATTPQRMTVEGASLLLHPLMRKTLERDEGDA